MAKLWVLGRCSRVGAAVETAGVVVVAMPTTRVTATVVIPPRVDVAVAVVDPTKGSVLPALVPKAGSRGWLLDVAGGGSAVVVAGVVVVESGTAGLEGRAPAWKAAETGGAVAAGVAVTMAAGERGASSCLVVVGGGVGSFVWPAPSLGRIAAVAVAVGLLPVGPTMVFPASPGLLVVMVTGGASLDTGLAVESPSCEFTPSSRTPRGQHKGGFWVTSQEALRKHFLFTYLRDGKYKFGCKISDKYN